MRHEEDLILGFASTTGQFNGKAMENKIVSIDSWVSRLRSDYRWNGKNVFGFNRERGLKFQFFDDPNTNSQILMMFARVERCVPSLLLQTRSSRFQFLFCAFVTEWNFLLEMMHNGSRKCQNVDDRWEFDPMVLQKPINFFPLLHHAMHFERKFLISHGDDDALNYKCVWNHWCMIYVRLSSIVFVS